MPSDDSIRPDASTVHRTAEEIAEAQRLLVSSDSSQDPLQIAEAKTVIRGSSFVERSKRRKELLVGTPATVAKVLLDQRLNHFHLEELIGGGGHGGCLPSP